ncbi:MAG: class I SAM-dependent methyltransferase [Flavobacteriaceae bacterium]
MNCILCKSKLSEPIYIENPHRFYDCNCCGSIVRSSDTFPNDSIEIERYESHNNDVNDPRYQKFVSPITNAVQADFEPQNSLGLDFGAGTGPVITKVLNDNGYHLNLYDPFFHPDTSVLEQHYDYIVCCEVIEHFHQPLKEFQRLKNLLKPQGKLYCMTDIFRNQSAFGNWYYKNDPTHVIFYTEKSLQWIQKEVGFENLTIDNRLIVYS